MEQENSFGESLVTTTLGEIRVADLRIEVKPVDETPLTWVYARECYYTGTEHLAAVDTLVRRDVWVSMKSGLAAAVESNL